jgi:putative ABC transport system permease protein
MFSHYFSTALRHMRQHLGTTLINLACLTFGLVGFVLAWGTAEYFAHFDNYHERADRTVVLTRFQPESQFTFHLSPAILTDHLRADFSNLEAVARAMYPQESALVVAGKSQFAQISYADPELLRIFDLPFTHGERRTALDDPQSAVISEALAVRLFGAVDVVGRRLRLSGGAADVTITGVIGNIRKPSHMSTEASSGFDLAFGFDALISMDMNPATGKPTRWDQDAYYTYAVLPVGGHGAIRRFDQELKGFSTRRVPPELQSEMVYGARPIADFMSISLDALARTDVTGVSSSTILRVLGILVLAIACLNYTNLATAVAMTHAKEIALRRVVGASRAQLAMQHFIEGATMTLAALGAALVIASSIAVAIGVDTMLACVSQLASSPQFWVALATASFVASIVASAYPALLLSRVRPAHALRSSSLRGGPRLTAVLLVGFQFAASSLLMVAMMVMLAQHRDLRRTISNPSSDPLVAIVNDVGSAGVNAELLRNELRRQPGVVAVSAINRMPWSPGADSDGLSLTANASANAAPLTRVFIDYDFFETLDVRLLAGRTFERDRADDVANVRAWTERDSAAASDFNVIVDSDYLPQLGAVTADAAVGRTVYRATSVDGSKPPQRLRIIGVVEPTSVMPLNAGLPGMFLLSPTAATVPIVRISKGDVPATLARIDAVWRKQSPEVPIKRRFADEQFDLAFQAFSRLNSAFAVLAIFASLIAVMGLIGMTLHVIRRRMHEIGVRKTLGARSAQIYTMLLRTFSVPVVIANIVVWPIVFPLMSGYLGIFANRTSLSIAPFFGSLFVSVVVACLAVSVQSLRAARMKPADVLRYE